ncbi:ClbS/DfsB family four-helix bundle protein [Flavobacterium sp. '19STA2R22 D10 B1']|uniref:ClbS/DfsB family four-helix bundle protein n=1 Tax=Flavobacterium aerium TaxID=3037261 RepID=UPI00278C571F|nr:ClbS/DfsB family four-helix bundle protein [Flavobacterium sp. '19STA2R22 D10 B1']
MAVPQNKQELLSAIEDSYAKLEKDLDLVPLEWEDDFEIEGHVAETFISVKNLVSYLIGWGELVLKWHRNEANGIAIDFPETDFKWNELGKLAQKFYQDYETYSYSELLTKLDEVVHEIIQIVMHYDTHDLYEVTWYNQWTRGRMIQFNTASPYKNARSRLRKWLKQKA